MVSEQVPKGTLFLYAMLIPAMEPQDWFKLVDLYNAYFHVPIALGPRFFFRFTQFKFYTLAAQEFFKKLHSVRMIATLSPQHVTESGCSAVLAGTTNLSEVSYQSISWKPSITSPWCKVRTHQPAGINQLKARGGPSCLQGSFRQ